MDRAGEPSAGSWCPSGLLSVPCGVKQKAALYLSFQALLNKAIEAALAARKEWDLKPVADRAQIFLKAADMLSGPRRAEILAKTMVGQVRVDRPGHAVVLRSCHWTLAAHLLCARSGWRLGAVLRNKAEESGYVTYYQPRQTVLRPCVLPGAHQFLSPYSGPNLCHFRTISCPARSGQPSDIAVWLCHLQMRGAVCTASLGQMGCTSCRLDPVPVFLPSAPPGSYSPQ